MTMRAMSRACPELEVGGRYRVLERVGLGGTAAVYRAWDERLKREVAVKLIAEWLRHDPVAIDRFHREAQVSARLTHPNIVAILDAGVEPQDFIVMEFVHGRDAGTLLRRQKRLAPREAVRVVTQVCKGLEYAHDHDIVHHDVSPRNVLIGRAGGSAKLADFGLASGVIEAVARRPEEVLGTPGYVAPEILRGSSPSPLSDLYSLGVVAHRLLGGLPQACAGDTTPQATAAPHIPPLAEARPDLPCGLIGAVHMALAPDPDARQGSVAEFRAQLADRQEQILRRLPGQPALPGAFQAELASAA
jgi:serine/threonine protein kinase